MRLSLITLVLTATVALASACAPSVQQVSSRPPNLFDKETGTVEMHGREPVAAQPAPEIFVRKREVLVQPADRPNDTGSLFNPEDERNYLFASSGPVTPGRYVTIAVASNRGAGTPAAKPAAAAAAAPADASKAKDGTGAPDAAEQELLKALPELEPADKDATALIKSFKMRILHRFENGDALAQFTRESQRDDEVNQVDVQARIPYERLVAGDGLTTADLFDVKLVESREGELVERQSSAWEDEYTMRLSGFSEAKSRLAMELDEKRKQLLETRENLETRIKTLADERQQVAKQRDDLAKKSTDTQTKIQGLEDKVKTQEETIQDQQEELDKLKPEDKPGDAKDGKDGK
jgi:hypothetical protein